VRFDYGAFALKEFSKPYPASFEQAPPRGQALLVGPGQAGLERHGLLVLVTRPFLERHAYRLTPRRVLDLVGSLRPILPGQ